jgi:hypothetical protein
MISFIFLMHVKLFRPCPKKRIFIYLKSIAPKNLTTYQVIKGSFVFKFVK